MIGWRIKTKLVSPSSDIHRNSVMERQMSELKDCMVGDMLR
jgi:hypothetical protein